MGRAAEPLEQERLNFEFHRIINAAADSRRISCVVRLLARFLPLHFWLSRHRCESILGMRAVNYLLCKGNRLAYSRLGDAHVW